jgi:hypothetical protein
MKTFLYTLALALTMLAGSLAFSPNRSLAACSDANLTSKEQIQCGVDTAAGGASAKPAGQTAQDTVIAVINVLSLVGGALAVIMIIYGGLRYVISGGNQEATKSAKNTIVYAVVGLVIIAIAQVIVQFVLTNTNDAVTGKTDTLNTPPPAAARQGTPSDGVHGNIR